MKQNKLKLILFSLGLIDVLVSGLDGCQHISVFFSRWRHFANISTNVEAIYRQVAIEKFFLAFVRLLATFTKDGNARKSCVG